MSRRQFLRQLTLSTSALGLMPRAMAYLPPPDTASRFPAGDTHYRADRKDFSKKDAISAGYNTRLVNWLNKLAGTNFTAETGGGTVASAPRDRPYGRYDRQWRQGLRESGVAPRHTEYRAPVCPDLSRIFYFSLVTVWPFFCSKAWMQAKGTHARQKQNSIQHKTNRRIHSTK